MKLLIFVTFIVGAFGQYLPPLTGKVPLSTYPGQGNYYPYQNQYPYQYGQFQYPFSCKLLIKRGFKCVFSVALLCNFTSISSRVSLQPVPVQPIPGCSRPSSSSSENRSRTCRSCRWRYPAHFLCPHWVRLPLGSCPLPHRSQEEWSLGKVLLWKGEKFTMFLWPLNDETNPNNFMFTL